MYAQTHIIVFGVLLALGASCDVASRRVPNWITVSIAVTGAWSQWVRGGLTATGSALAAAIAVAVLLVPLWKKGFLGGGDTKMAIAAAVWVGLAKCPVYLLAIALAGGIVAVVKYATSKRETRVAVRANLWRLHVPTSAAALPRSVPYAVAIAAGALIALQI